MTRLTGIGVLVTRPEHQANHLCQLIESEGGAAIRYPALVIKPRPDRAALRAAIGPADATRDVARWLEKSVVISKRRVDGTASYRTLRHPDRRPPDRPVGPARASP